MAQRTNNGHAEQILDLMQEFDLFAVDTLFNPVKKKKLGKKYKICNVTYMPKEAGKRPTKLDYLCISNR